jgi:type VI secretion system protein ImpH
MTVADEPRERTQAPGIADELFQHAERFTFLQAVRLLELLHPNRTAPAEGVDPRDELVLFRQYVGFDFAPGDVEFLVPPRHDREPATMSVNVLGLTGALGPLPHHLTDLLLERTGRGDRAMRDFLDIFNHRLISLLYRARSKYRPALATKGPHKSRVAGVLYSILGLGTGNLLDRLDLADRSLLPYTGLFAEQSRSSVGLERVVEDCFGVPANVVQFQGVWHTLEESDVTRIGINGRNNALGRGAILGRRVYDPTANFELRLGPMSYARFITFLPKAAAFKPLKSLVRFYTREELGFSFRLCIAKDEIPPLRLALRSVPSGAGEAFGTTRRAESPSLQEGPRLGWTSWLKTRPAQADDAQVSISGSRT